MVLKEQQIRKKNTLILYEYSINLSLWRVLWSCKDVYIFTL